jgi:hypothetical protein
MQKNIFYLKILIILLLLEKNAYAYLDPGSGSIVLQILVAILATITFYIRATLNFIKIFLLKIKNFFKKKND